MFTTETQRAQRIVSFPIPALAVGILTTFTTEASGLLRFAHARNCCDYSLQ